MTNYLTVREVAAATRCDHRVVRKAIKNGELEAALIGGRYLIRETAVDEWFEAKRTTPGPPVPRQRTAPRVRQRTTEGQRSVARLRAMDGR